MTKPRAFRVKCPYLSGAGIYVASGASRARAKAYWDALDAGYRNVKFIDFTVLRAPEYDVIRGKLTDGRASEDYAKWLLGEHTRELSTTSLNAQHNESGRPHRRP